MGNKQKRKIARLQSRVAQLTNLNDALEVAGANVCDKLAKERSSSIRFNNQLAESLDLLEEKLLQLQREDNQKREEIAELKRKLADPPYPTIVSFRSFMRAMEQLPESPIRVYGPDSDCVVPAMCSPDSFVDVHPDKTMTIDDISCIMLHFRKSRVIAPDFRKEPVYGWMIPAGVVVVDMDQRED